MLEKKIENQTSSSSSEVQSDIAAYRQDAAKRYQQKIEKEKQEQLQTQKQQELAALKDLLENVHEFREQMTTFKTNFFDIFSGQYLECLEKMKEKCEQIKAVFEVLIAEDYLNNKAEDYIEKLNICNLFFNDLMDNISMLSKKCYEEYVIPLSDTFFNVADGLDAYYLKKFALNPIQNITQPSDSTGFINRVIANNPAAPKAKQNATVEAAPSIPKPVEHDRNALSGLNANNNQPVIEESPVIVSHRSAERRL